MKKCPNCQKTYDDTLKFCQSDGTPLVAVAEDAPEESPYKTVVGDASSLPIPPEEKKPETEAKPEPEPEPEPEQEMDPFKTMVAGSKMAPPKEEDVLEVPASPVDPMKTMVVSGQTSGNIEIDIPEEEEKAEPAAESTPAPEVAASEPAPSAAPAEPEPASTPADAPAPAAEELAAAPPAADKPSEPDKPSVPIPSPFEESMPPGFAPPATPPFEEKVNPVEPQAQTPEPEPEPELEPEMVNEPVAEPLPSDFSDVSPGGDDIGEVEPAVPVVSSGQEIEASAAQPPAEGQAPNQTLSWVSLALGILSLPCCMSYIFGIAAIIVGFMARSKASAEPENYGGGTYAMIGIVLGLVSVLLGTILWVVQILLGGFADLLR